ALNHRSNPLMILDLSALISGTYFVIAIIIYFLHVFGHDISEQQTLGFNKNHDNPSYLQYTFISMHLLGELCGPEAAGRKEFPGSNIVVIYISHTQDIKSQRPGSGNQCPNHLFANTHASQG